MAQDSKIAWTHSTWNLIWGCEKISPGCVNCYADTLSSRYGFDVWGPGKKRRVFPEKHWREPLAWDRKAAKDGYRHRVFCSSMTDVFLDDPTVTTERAKLWPLIKETPNLDWLLLTKRSGRIADCLPPDWGEGYPNVWLGVSVESQPYTSRIDDLLKVPAVVRFVSAEPLLGSLDLTPWLLPPCGGDVRSGHLCRLCHSWRCGLDWVIVGGESGAGFRPMDDKWVRDIRRQVEGAGMSFFFKQHAAFRSGTGEELDGEVVKNYPTPRRIALPMAAQTELFR
jgi:Bacteriophage protein gp37